MLQHAGQRVTTMRKTDAGSGGAAPGLARVLSLAATPVFAAMALWAAASGTAPEIFCMPGSPLNGMAAMYVLMSVFHAGPWLTLLQSR